LEDILQAERVKFQRYADLLAEWNDRFDLTAVPAEDTWTRHFSDSLQLLKFADFNKKRAIDVGSGAGFPGVPVKIAVPQLSLTLLDASVKRADFLRILCSELSIDADIINARAENAAKPADPAGLRESFDFAFSRAVANLKVLSELTLPFVKVGGAAILHKGERVTEEILAADEVIVELGAAVERVQRCDFGNIVVLRKICPAPDRYPRPWKKISAGWSANAGSATSSQ
jgi:16S rRNA (guanine527-N7)-methyltransferase